MELDYVTLKTASIVFLPVSFGNLYWKPSEIVSVLKTERKQQRLITR